MKLNEQAVLRFMSEAGYQPMDASQLARSMEIHSNDRAALRNILRKLAAAEKIREGKKARWELVKSIPRSTPRELVGTIRFAPQGFACVYADATAPENEAWDFTQFDRFRAEARDCGTALDGDRVLAQVLATPTFSPFGQQAKAKEAEQRPPKVRRRQVISPCRGQVLCTFRGQG